MYVGCPPGALFLEEHSRLRAVLALRPVGRVTAIVNQKGGVGKTTTAVSLASALCQLGRRTLLVDADPQANATRALGIEADAERPSTYDALTGLAAFDEIRVSFDSLPLLSIVPSDRDLVGIEIELVDQPQREYRLRSFLEGLEGRFDHVLIDCPPSLGLITVNALVAADAVLIPVQAEFLALEGISQVMDTVERIRQSLNPRLDVAGIAITMFDERTNLARQVVDEVRGFFGNRVFKTIVPRSVRLSEAPSHGLPISLYDPKSKGGEAYASLAKEFDVDEHRQAPGPGPRPEQPDPAAEASIQGSGDAGQA
jgi:chromosome partitioning protein